MKKIILVLFVLFITGCTTNIAGRGFIPVEDSSNQYTIKIHTGGFAFMPQAREVAVERAEALLKSKPQYTSYKEVSSKWSVIPSGVTFVYEFN